jgi:hypothetical protein
MQGDTHECFTLRFQKGGNQVENYFVCKDCKITWVRVCFSFLIIVSLPPISHSCMCSPSPVWCVYAQVCEACAKECHKGHTVVNYMPNHKPTWACCYCPKNRKCQIPNAKTKRG